MIMKGFKINFCVALFFGIVLSSCEEKSEQMTVGHLSTSNTVDSSEKREISANFSEYWYADEAEITSYQLSQERYGELRDGTVVTVFVTEDFLPKDQVKANSYSAENTPVLKLNTTKKFLTGIYPYSIMTSTFSPVKQKGHALKVTASVQEWCGHVFMQLNNRKNFEIDTYSYFASEGDRKVSLEKTWLEDELWNLIRINPNELPTGEISVVPSFESIRLRHKKLEAYPATASLNKGDSISSYELKYPGIQRDVIIYFNSRFPFEIEKWEETNARWGRDTTRLKTTATRMKRIKSAYWGKNDNEDVVLRDSLGLKTY